MIRPVFRPATATDVPTIVKLLREDDLGAARETAPDTYYVAAFAGIAAAPQNHLIVGEESGRVIAYYHLTVLEGLSHRAARRGNIEDVRVAEALRGQGIGHLMMEDAAERARRLGCGVLQLVAHGTRHATHAFYLSAGFTASHMGFKRPLSDPEEQQ